MLKTVRFGSLPSIALLCLLLTCSGLSATQNPAANTKAANAVQTEPSSLSARPRVPAKRVQAPVLPFYGQTWFLVTVGALILVGLKFGATLVPSRESHTTTGRLANKEELLTAYAHEWGTGGYMLGLLPPESKSSLFERLIAAVRRRRGKAVLGLPPEKRLSHALMQAGPGAGKTTTGFIPQLVEDAHSGLFNVFIVDRK
ncbi:MAG: hypothetical protein ACREAC_01085, partial [Blastocatellia bacterium]